MRFDGPARSALALALAALLAACTTAGPDYVRPRTEVPAAWQTEAPFRAARPTDDAPKGPWWQRFGDARLNDLQRQAQAASPTLAIAAARLAQARALLAGTSAATLPQLGLGARAARARISADRPLTNYNSSNFATVQNDFVLSMSVSYELDLAGRVARTVEGAAASAEQAAADAENTRLVLAADVATAYFNLRAVDADLDVLTRAIDWQQRALDLVQSRRDLGAASGLEVAQQRSLLDATRVQLELLRRQRAVFQHALATLVGAPAPAFAEPANARPVALPEVPMALPSDVLERRPDVASAERAMAAANAQIGVARAAFFPSISLGGVYGTEGRATGMLFDAPSILWSLGATAAQMLFDGGRLAANEAAARAAHAATEAAYRRTVLVALQEVEDGLSGLATLKAATEQAGAALASARRVLDLATARYEGGAAGYLEVIVAQQSVLAAERQLAQLRGQQAVTTVFLFKALGGDWRV